MIVSSYVYYTRLFVLCHVVVFSQYVVLCFVICTVLNCVYYIQLFEIYPIVVYVKY